MAKAEARKVQREVVKVVEDEVIQLTLTRAEALTLKTVLGVISGSAEDSRRKHTEDIWKALGQAGVASSPDARRHYQWSYEHAMRFTVEPGFDN